MYARTGAGPAAHGDVVVERRTRGGHCLVLGDTDPADCATRAGDAERREHRLCEADALEDGVDVEAVGEFAQALDRLLASLAHDVRRAELSRQRDPVGMAVEDDDLLGTEAPGSDHAAQADGAVTNNGHRLPWADVGRDGRMMARPHHV